MQFTDFVSGALELLLLNLKTKQICRKQQEQGNKQTNKTDVPTKYNNGYSFKHDFIYAKPRCKTVPLIVFL